MLSIVYPARAFGLLSKKQYAPYVDMRFMMNFVKTCGASVLFIPNRGNILAMLVMMGQKETASMNI